MEHLLYRKKTTLITALIGLRLRSGNAIYQRFTLVLRLTIKMECKLYYNIIYEFVGFIIRDLN